MNNLDERNTEYITKAVTPDRVLELAGMLRDKISEILKDGGQSFETLAKMEFVQRNPCYGNNGWHIITDVVMGENVVYQEVIRYNVNTKGNFRHDFGSSRYYRLKGDFESKLPQTYSPC